MGVRRRSLLLGLGAVWLYWTSFLWLESLLESLGLRSWSDPLLGRFVKTLFTPPLALASLMPALFAHAPFAVWHAAALATVAGGAASSLLWAVVWWTWPASPPTTVLGVRGR